MKEKALIKSAKAGNFEAFNDLVAGHTDRIYRLALKITGNTDDSEDIVQNTFLKAIDKIDQFREDASFGTWVYAIALNEIRRCLSHRNSFKVKSIDEYLPNSHSDSTIELFDWGDPHKYMKQREIREIIDSSLENMSEKYSIPFILRYMEQLSIKEIAETLDLSEAAVKSRILRTRLALREKLSKIFRERKYEKM